MKPHATRTRPWRSLEAAAKYLDESSDGLRKKLERVRRIGPDGVVEAELDGLRGRKLGRLWKVKLSEAWED